MKSKRFSGVSAIHIYQVGDLVLEADRSGSFGLDVLSTQLSTQALQEATEAQKEEFLDFLKTKAEDYAPLKSALRFLKFNPQEVREYHEAIGSVVNMAASCVTIVGAVLTVADLLNRMFGSQAPNESLQRLQHISERVDQIYGYLAAQERRGLHDEAVAWRSHIDDVRNAVANARGSRSPINLKALVDLKPALDGSLSDMLDPSKGDIAFLRGVYGYPAFAHWIDAAAAPFVTLTDGTPVNYREPAAELQAGIWDPGHYVDMLVGSLMDRLLLVATTEPAFRSTNYDRDRLEGLLDKLTAFLNKWRGSFLVGNPLVGLNGGGHLQHPATEAPIGIPIGAVDPVTGLAFFKTFWDDFTVVSTWEGSLAAKGRPDYTEAKDPALALQRALDLQPRLLAACIQASGLGKLAEVRARLQAVLARYTTGSDFVDLPNATFHLVELLGPAAQSETVDLGFIGRYSQHPNKQYSGERYYQSLEKRFRFGMALRADVSMIQLGYRMTLGETSIPLIDYSVAPGDGSMPPRFRTEPISLEIRRADVTVYDVYQSGLATSFDEDRFEGIEPPAGLLDTVQVFRTERLFLNPRTGPVALKVDITFEADLDNADQPYAGFANVTIRNLDPMQCPGGLILPVTVFETRRVGLGTATEEVPADHMTVHIVPSFLALGREYFDDRREGVATMERLFDTINDRFAISRPAAGPVGPEWQIRRRVAQEIATDAAIRRFADAEPEAVHAAMQRFAVPMARAISEQGEVPAPVQ